MSIWLAFWWSLTARFQASRRDAWSASRCTINAPGVWLTTAPPVLARKPLARHILVHPRRRCTTLCCCCRRIWLGTTFLTLGNSRCLRMQSLPGTRLPLMSGFWICFFGSSDQGAQMSPHYTPLAHDVALSGPRHGILAWCVVCGVHPAASVRMNVDKPSPSCLVVRPLVLAPSANDAGCLRGIRSLGREGRG